MRKWLVPLVLALFLGAVPARSHAVYLGPNFTVSATLSGLNEPIPNTSPGTGTAAVTYTQAFGSNPASLAVQINYANLVGNPLPPPSGAAIFYGNPTQIGPAVISLLSFPTTKSGSYSSGPLTSFIPVTTNPNGLPNLLTFGDVVEAIFLGRTYVNIRTTAPVFGSSGEIRGQLLNPVTVPEPTSLALLMLGGLGFLAAARGVRRRPA